MSHSISEKIKQVFQDYFKYKLLIIYRLLKKSGTLILFVIKNVSQLTLYCRTSNKQLMNKDIQHDLCCFTLLCFNSNTK